MPFKSKAQRRLMYAKESQGEVPKGTAAEWESHTDDTKLPERVKKTMTSKDIEPMEKGWKDSMGAMGVAAALGATAPAGIADAAKGTAPATSIAPAPKIGPMHGFKVPSGVSAGERAGDHASLDPLHHHLFVQENPKPEGDVWEGLSPQLRAIAVQESGSGKNVNHTPDPRGVWNTAVGTVGLQPATAAEVAKQTHVLKKKYGDLLDNRAAFVDKFKKDPKFYNELANNVWNRMVKDMGDHRKAAYGWRWGAYSMGGKPESEIYEHPYVKKYLNNLQQLSGGMHKSEPLAKELPGISHEVGPFFNKAAANRNRKLLHAHKEAVKHHGSLAQALQEMGCLEDAQRHRDLEGKHTIIVKRILDHNEKQNPGHALLHEYHMSPAYAKHAAYDKDDAMHRGGHDLDSNLLEDGTHYGHTCTHCEQVLGSMIGGSGEEP